MHNSLKTAVLLGAMTALFLVVGALLGGRGGLTFALLMAAGMNLGAYWFSDKIVLKMYRAKEVGPDDRTGLFIIVKELAARGGMPMPRVYVVDDEMPNAFATGRNPANASVAATTGIIKLLSLEELTGVMAHELCHVRHRDTLIGAVAATFAGAIGYLANIAMWTGGRNGAGRGAAGAIAGVLTMILAPMAAGLVQMAVSRSREFEADAGGARLCGQPLWLASALEKMHQVGEQRTSQIAESHPATAHLFIMNPLHGKQVKHLFSTHPPMEERVRRLREMNIRP